MSRERDGRPTLSDEELQGFLQFLFATNELPEATPEVLAYLERASAHEQITDDEARQLAKSSILAITAERLQAAHVTPVRPLGIHLSAKRIAAKCSSAQVASALNEDVRGYERLESGERDPLEIPAALLVRVIELFGLRIAELREALLGHLDRGQPRGEFRFARGGTGEFANDQLAIAADDLRNASHPKRVLAKEAIDLVESKVAEVRALLDNR